jgi:hypothetical protein
VDHERASFGISALDSWHVPFCWLRAQMFLFRKACLDVQYPEIRYRKKFVAGDNRRLHNQSQERADPWPDYLCNGDFATLTAEPTASDNS